MDSWILDRLYWILKWPSILLLLLLPRWEGRRGGAPYSARRRDGRKEGTDGPPKAAKAPIVMWVKEGGGTVEGRRIGERGIRVVSGSSSCVIAKHCSREKKRGGGKHSSRSQSKYTRQCLT